MELEPGTVVDRYRIGRELGKGGIAVVYMAKHVQLDSLHALKVVSAPGRSVRERLLQEGKVQSTLRHPNLVSVTDLVVYESAPILVMELIRGPSLASFLASYRPTLVEADRVARGILEGMICAHQAKVIHRDLKPANVLLAIQGQELVPKVADFGLVKIVDEGKHSLSTRTGVVMGTPAYMAPEQLRDSSKVDARADVFALGAVLYELLCGAQAFVAEDTVSLLNKICDGDYPPIREQLPELPGRMVRAIEGALQVNVKDRIPTVEALLDVWTADEDGHTVELPPARREPWSEAALGCAERLAPTVDHEAMDSGSTEEPAGSTFNSSAPTMDFGLSVVEEEPAKTASASAEPTFVSAEPSLESEPARNPLSELMVFGTSPWGLAITVLVVVVWLWAVLKPSPQIDVSVELASDQRAGDEGHVSRADMTTLHLVAAGQDPAAEARLQQGIQATYVGEFEKADRLYKTVVKIYPADPAVNLMMAVNHCLLLQSGPCQDRITRAEDGSRNLKTPAAELARLVYRTLYETERREEVVAEWNQFMQGHPELRPAHLHRVITLFDLDEENWLDHVGALITLAPDVIISYGLKASFLGLHNRELEALALLEDKLQRYPASSFLRAHQARIYGLLGRVEDQRAVLDGLIRDDPNYGSVMQMRAEDLLAQGDEEGLESVTSILTGAATPVAKQISFARRHLQLLYGYGRAAEADGWVEDCAKRGRESKDQLSVIRCYMAAAGAHYHLEQLEEALEWTAKYRDAYDRPETQADMRSAHSTTLVYNKGLTALARGQIELAAVEFARLQDIDEEAFGFTDKGELVATSQAELASARGDVEGALQLLKSVKRTMDPCDAEYKYGMIYLKNKRFDEFAQAVDRMGAESCVHLPILRIVRARFFVEMAAIHASGGRNEEAAVYLERFDEAWPRPDEDLPLVVRANTLRDELGLTNK